jgi:exodeoxyribonuclease V alpha subunit
LCYTTYIPDEIGESNVKKLEKDYGLYLEESKEKILVTLKSVYIAERKVFNRIKDMIKENFDIESRGEEPECKHLSDNLIDEQIEAIKGALRYSICFIVGGAGTGKSTIIQQIVANSNDVSVCSFTGKAVQRLNSMSDIGASTIHRMISQRTGRKTKHLIIDEISMVTTELLYEFIATFPHEYKITMVGDPNQLQPIGWGSLMLELLSSKRIPVFKLHVNHRIVNSDATALLENVKNIALGCTTLIEDRSFKFIEGDLKKLEGAIKAYSAKIPYNDVTVVTPYNKYVQPINELISKYYFTSSVQSFRWKDRTFIKGERVMMTANNYKLGIMNGEEGIIVDPNVHGHGKEMHVKFNDRIVTVSYAYRSYSRQEDLDEESDLLFASDLLHSSALTVHKAQGSEYANVLFFIPNYAGASFASFVNLHLIYTAVSRARKSLLVIGSKSIFEAGIKQPRPFRNDKLCEFLKTINLPNDSLDRYLNYELETVQSDFDDDVFDPDQLDPDDIF